jgi:CRISPR system Cascade subunit CasB
MSWLTDRLSYYKEKDDRGMMANLRCFFTKSRRHRAWPALNRLGVSIENENQSYIAGYYATHPEHGTSSDDFGATCRAIMLQRDKRTDDKLTPVERRFQHLLTATKEEVYGRVLRMVLFAKSEGVPVNYDLLETDLRFWGDKTKTKWASSFWTTQSTESEEDAR